MEQESSFKFILQMGTKILILLLLVCFFQYSCSRVTTPHYVLTSSPVHMQGSKKVTDSKEYQNNSGGNDIITQKGKMGHASGSHGGNGGDGGGGGEESHPNPQGGGTHVPQYAGAANSHHNYHKNAGIYIQSCTGTSIFIAAISLVHVFYINFNKF